MAQGSVDRAGRQHRRVNQSKMRRQREVLFQTLESRLHLSATWTALSNAAPSGIHNMLLLGNGDVMAELGGGASWALLTPSSTGSYVSGTWTMLSNMHDTRTYYSSQVLENGSVYVAGGEYGTGGAAGEVYNPTTNTWTPIPTGVGSYIDADSEILPNGLVLEAPVYPASSGYTYFYNASSNTWTTAAKLYTGSDADEQNWVKLADGSILSPDGTYTSQRYIPSLNQWVNDATTTLAQTDSLGEFGTGVLLPNGDAFFVGTGSTTELYTPSGTSSPGSWSAGPTLPTGYGQDDAPAAVLPDGNVLFCIGPIDSYSGPTTFDIYNPTTNTISAATGAPTVSGPPYGNRFLDLPDGTVLMTTGGSTLYDYNDAGTTLTAPTPTITSIVHNSDGSYTLTGTQLNGNSEGAYYGDDAQMNSNYPMVRLTSSTGTVYFATSYNWSTDNVDTGSTPVTTNFKVPLGLPAGTYTVNVMVNGFVSAGTATTITNGSGDTAPTVATTAAATPSPTGLTTTNLSVLGASANGESTLAYTWTTTSTPSGASTPSFSINGTNAAKNTTATFQQAGTYTFKVYITDALGLSTTSSVTVTVNQTLTSMTLTPGTGSLTAGSNEQLTATGYDQFGNSMTTQPTFSYALNSGGGKVTTYGLYISPSSGTLATVKATTGSLTAYATIGVVSQPWASADIGTVTYAGTTYDSSGTYNMQASGEDIWGTSDDFHYMYKAFSGDMTVTAEVTSISNSTGWAKDGVMIRNSLSASDQFVFVAVTPSNGISMQDRVTSAASAVQTADVTGKAAPYWVRLVRSGSTFTGYYSANGTTWTQEGSVSITMGTSVYVGLCADANNTTTLGTSTFTNVSVTQPANTAPTISTAAAATAVQGYSSDLSVLGADDEGDANLTYSWTASTLPAGAAQPTYSANGTNAAKNTVAFFSSPGTYTMTVTITDSGGLTVTSSVSVVVNAFSTASPVGIWNFDEGTGTTTADSSGNHHGGNLSSGVTWTTGVTGAASDHALSLSGTNSEVTFGTGPSLSGTGGFTVVAWVKTTATTAGIIMQQRDVAGYNGEYQLSMNANGTVNFFIYGGSYQFGTSGFSTLLSVNDGAWHQIVAVRDGTDGRIYLDGALAATASGTDASLTSTITTDIGEDARSGGTFFIGTIDDARLYGRAIAPSEVTALFSSNGPGVATPAASSPNPVTAKTANLSVLGSSGNGESTLTYNWVATTIPTGATAPTFSVNGTNAAKATTATFTMAGTYVFTVTITDANALSTTSSVTVVVNQTLTTITISPTSAALHFNQTQTFTASGYDQFGQLISSQPAFSWSSVGSGSINAGTGVYTAPASAGTATITATSGSVTRTASVSVTNGAPTVATAASGTPSTITGTSTALSVLGADDGGESNLTYTWATTTKPSGAATPTFSINGTNAAKNSTVSNLNKAGSYTFTVTITDSGGLTTTSAVTVTVTATLTSITVTPTSAGINENATQTFTATAYDQFGTALASQPTFTWSISSGSGSITSAGVYTATGSTGSATVVATSGSVSGTANVTVTNANPTVTTAATASPSTVTGTTAVLSVVAADDGGASNLIYTWSATTVPTGGTPLFGTNGTNSAATSTVTFNKAGAYTFLVTITDGQGGSTTSSVNVTVSQTLSSAVVTPATAAMNESQTQAFSATGYDQFGLVMTSQPTFTWTRTGSGSINSSTGVYTSPPLSGSATITATSGSVTAHASVTTTNGSPTVATAPSATPAPVTAKTTALSVLGADDGGESNLTYTWTATTLPVGASQPTYSTNATNAAKNTTATFSKAGNYVFTVTMADLQGASSTATVSVTVSQTLTSITVSPSTTSVSENTTKTFTAVAYDQFGVALISQPTFSWSSTGAGSINSSSGVYTAPGSTGSASISATSSSISGTASVTVTNTAPTLATPAAASPSTVTTTSTSLSVLGADDGGESNLTYAWSATTVPNGAAVPQFSINGTNAAKNTTVTFARAGAYTLTATITDGQGGTTTSSVNVTVNQSLSSIIVTPNTASLNETQTQAFTAVGYDQFSAVMTSQPTFTWSNTGVGSVNSSSGVYSAPVAAGSATIIATSGTITGSAGVSVTNATPTVATAASISPTTVNGITATLHVLGADDGGESNLTYTWTASNLPAGAAQPSYTNNNSNAGKLTTVAFSQAGNYTLTVTIDDGQGGTTTSSVNVTVTQSLSSVLISPQNISLAENATQRFGASGEDQFGNPMASQPTFSWSSTGAGSINSATGVYTAPATSGTATITATGGNFSDSTGVTINNNGPTVAAPAAATPGTVNSNTATLSVLGADDNGESNLTYTWAASGVPGTNVPSPTFSANSTNAAKNTNVTFYKAGAYTFTVTITDAQGASTTSSVNVMVNQTLSGASAAAIDSATITNGTTQITATDQFGNTMPASAVTWGVSGGGSISSSGLFTAGPSAGTSVVTATIGHVTETVDITVVPTVFTNANGSDTYSIQVDPTNPLVDDIYVNTADNTSPTYTVAINLLSGLAFTPTGGDGSLTVSFANGNPVPDGGITYIGGATPENGGNTLYITGTSSGGLNLDVDAKKVTDTADVNASITYSNLQSIEFDLSGGSNTLTQLAEPSAPVVYNAGAGNNTLTVNGGSFNVLNDPGQTSGNLTINDNAIVTFNQAPTGGGYFPLNVAALNLSPGAAANVLTVEDQSHLDVDVLILGSLSIGTGATLDLGGNTMIVHNGNPQQITNWLTQGYNAGGTLWGGTGIVSDLAAQNPGALTTLGVMSNKNGNNAIRASFEGQTVSANDVLVKYTYYGDANEDGTVDGSDYSRIDSAVLTGATGWYNGDFNYDGVINGSDYTLIDNAYNMQGAQYPLVAPSAEIAALSKPARTSFAGNLPAIAGSTPSSFFSSSPIASTADEILDASSIRQGAKAASVLFL